MIKNSIKMLCATLIALATMSCKTDIPDLDFRQEMRNFVIDLSTYSRQYNGSFIVIPQNGQELITKSGDIDSELQTNYIQAINATGREDLFYGYTSDNVATPKVDNAYMLSLCNLCEQNNIEVLAIDYCSSHDKMDNSYQQNAANNFISFAANERNLTNIPDYPVKPFHENPENITKISQAKNFLYLINPENYNSKPDFISAVNQTNYDVVIMDLFHNEDAYTNVEIQQLKTKLNGGKRLVICYMSIGESEDYRFYWQNTWKTNKPDWLLTENPQWKGNYKVRYWEKSWQNIIYGNDASYLKKILDAGFDGVYLDLIDAFEYFE